MKKKINLSTLSKFISFRNNLFQKITPLSLNNTVSLVFLGIPKPPLLKEEIVLIVLLSDDFVNRLKKAVFYTTYNY